MAGLVPAIHDLRSTGQTWMPGTGPGMTMDRSPNRLRRASNTVALRFGYQPGRIVRQQEAPGNKIVGRFFECGDISLLRWVALFDRRTGIRGRKASLFRRCERDEAAA